MRAAWMNRRPMLIALSGAMLALGGAAEADEHVPTPPERHALTDAELDAITAGTASTDPAELLTFDVVRRTRGGKTVTAVGDLTVVESFEAFDPAVIGALTLTDGAQSNLSSVININAVNSAVNVLLNLNISIDSTVGSIEQANLNTAMSALPAGPAIPSPAIK